MFRKLFRGSVYLSALWPINADNLKNQTPTEKNVDFSQIPNETGYDRLRRMFTSDEFGDYSKELTTVLHVTYSSVFVGACYGGIMHSRTTYMDFLQRNQATAFVDPMEARKRLQDAITKSFGRGAFKWAWRLSLFCSSFAGVTTAISVYRGKSGIIEYVAGGFVSGAIYKINMGPKGMLVGGIIGSLLGTVGGCISLGILTATGMTMEEVRYWQYNWRRQRRETYNKNIAKNSEDPEDRQFKIHDLNIDAKGVTLDGIEPTK